MLAVLSPLARLVHPSLSLLSNITNEHLLLELRNCHSIEQARIAAALHPEQSK